MVQQCKENENSQSAPVWIAAPVGGGRYRLRATGGYEADAAGRQSDSVRQVKDEPIQFRNARPKHPAA